MSTRFNAYVVVEKWKSRSKHAVDGYVYGAWSTFFLDYESAEKERKRLSNVSVFKVDDEGELFVMEVAVNG